MPEDNEKRKREDDEGHAVDSEAKADDGGEKSEAKRKRKRKRKKKGGSNAAGDGSSGAAGAEDQHAKLTSMDHTVYVEGIPFDCSEDDVKQFFVSNGVEDVIQMRLSKWQDSGRLRGFGHIVFDTEDSRTKALSDLNGLTLGKRYITVKEANAPKAGTTGAAGAGDGKPRDQPSGCRVVFVKNLPYDATEEIIHDVLRSCGKIVEGGVRVVRNYSTRQSKGFAYVEFKNPEGAFAAVQRAAKPFGLVITGRPCFVDYDESRGPKGSYRTGDGKLWKGK